MRTSARVTYVAPGLHTPASRLHSFPSRREALDWVDEVRRFAQSAGYKVLGYDIMPIPDPPEGMTTILCDDRIKH